MSPSPRPTVAQAIEVLKTHQLRRENTVIFNEIQTLRNEVLALQDHSTEVQRAGAEADTGLQRLKQHSADLEHRLEDVIAMTTTCTNDMTVLRKDVQSHKTSIEEQLKSVSGEQIGVDAQVASLVAKLDQQGADHDAEFIRLERAFEELSGELRSKVKAGVVAQVSSLQQHQHRTITQPQMTPRDSINRISETHNSEIERKVAEDHADAGVDSDMMNLGDMLREGSPAFGRYPGEDDMMLTAGRQDETMPSAQQVQSALVQDSIEAADPRGTDQLDPDTKGTKYNEKASTARHTATRKVVNSPESLTWPDHYETLLAILNLRQLHGERVAGYLDRSAALLQLLEGHTEATRVCLKRVVSGLPDPYISTYTSAWLNSSRWTLSDLKECFVLLNILLPPGCQVPASDGSSDELHADVGPEGSPNQSGLRRFPHHQALPTHNPSDSVASITDLDLGDGDLGVTNSRINTDQLENWAPSAQRSNSRSVASRGSCRLASETSRRVVAEDQLRVDHDAVLSSAAKLIPKVTSCDRRESIRRKGRRPIGKRHCKCSGERHLTENHRRTLSRAATFVTRPSCARSSIALCPQTPEEQACVLEEPECIREVHKRWKVLEVERSSMRSSPPFTSAQKMQLTSSPEPEQLLPNKRIRLSQTKTPTLVPTKHRYNLRGRRLVEQDTDLPPRVDTEFSASGSEHRDGYETVQRSTREDHRQEPLSVPILQISTSDRC